MDVPHFLVPHLLVDAIESAVCAGEAILEVYRTDFEVQTKADNSPLTVADQRAHALIKSGLAHHGIPSISEEGRHLPYETRRNWPLLWIVDPLDGTKEFVKRNGEFTVNIALVAGQRPVMGVVYAPVPGCLYFGSKDHGAFKLVDASRHVSVARQQASLEHRIEMLIASAFKLPLAQKIGRPYTVVGSRSHATPELAAFVDRKRAEMGVVEFIAAGSSLKICLVAEGAADVYPRMGPTMEWDTAAGQAVAECAGARVYRYDDGTPLTYNKPDLLNPWFVVER